MKVLFVCEGNINRSQMAAGFLRAMSPKTEVMAAGTLVPPEREGMALRSVAMESTNAMRKVGIDIGDSLIHRLQPSMVADADKVVLVGPTPGGPLPSFLAGSQALETWDVPDPGYGQISVEDARDMVKKKVDEFVARLH